MTYASRTSGERSPSPGSRRAVPSRCLVSSCALSRAGAGPHARPTRQLEAAATWDATTGQRGAP
eukprot:10855550-Lingulodinium_polyedra.AAC.1